MMRYYSVYDKVADDFSPVFQAKNDVLAWRAFELGYKQGKDIPGDFSDYELWYCFTLPDSLEFISISGEEFMHRVNPLKIKEDKE